MKEGKFTLGLSTHIGLEKSDILTSVSRKITTEIDNFDKVIPEQDRILLMKQIANRIRALIQYGITKEKIENANIRDVSVAFSVLLNQLKKFPGTIETKEELKGVADALIRLSKRNGLLGSGEDVDTNVSLPSGETE